MWLLALECKMVWCRDMGEKENVGNMDVDDPAGLFCVDVDDLV